MRFLKRENRILRILSGSPKPEQLTQIPKIKLYIAATLDGYIARENGALDWLDGLPNPDQNDYGYPAFYQTIDTVIMGRKTYEQILGFDVPWPYKACKSYVISSNPTFETASPNTRNVKEIDRKFIDQIKSESKKNIWLVGGGSLISAFLNLGAVDELMLCLTPHLLGKGIPLFPGHQKETALQIVKTEQFKSGAVMLTYNID